MKSVENFIMEVQSKSFPYVDQRVNANLNLMGTLKRDKDGFLHLVEVMPQKFSDCPEIQALWEKMAKANVMAWIECYNETVKRYNDWAGQQAAKNSIIGDLVVAGLPIYNVLPFDKKKQNKRNG
jgi:hypothetical protein